jgi:hypothetical protein
MGNRQEVLIHRFPNGTTQHTMYVTSSDERTGGSETSQYPQEEKSIEILLVAASENGIERLYLAY